jgi:ParB family chromosome partitioning protein
MAGNKFNLNSLLNSTSKSAARQDNEQEKPVTQKSSLKVIPISVHSLIPSKDNFYSVEQIED